MKTVGLRELKNGLSRYVHEVRQGQEILITDRGRVVASAVLSWLFGEPSGRLTVAAASWNLLRLDAGVIQRARQPFPSEPIRTLDALHVASALPARAAVPDPALLSLDDRVRASGRGLGLEVLPA